MDSNKLSIVLVLLLIWSGFIVWEMDVQASLKTISDDLFRFDLLLLPVLAIFTVYALFILFKKRNY